MEHPVTLTIQPSNLRRLLMPICPHIIIIIIPISPRLPFLRFMLYSFLPPFLTHITLPTIRNHATPTQSRRLRRSTQSRAIRSLAAQDCRFIIIPIAFPEAKATIFGPEKEPDRSEYKGEAEEGEEGEEAVVVDVVGIDGARAGLIVWILWSFCGRASR